MNQNQGQQNQGGFQEVGNNSSNNPRWEPQKTQLVSGAPFPRLEGYFKELREINGQNGVFCVAVIVTMNPNGTLGQEVDVSGGKVLDDKLEEIPLGSFIALQYEGKHPSKVGGRTYNLWKTFVDPGAVSYAQLGGMVKQTPVQNNNQQQFQQQVQNQGQPAFNPQQGFQNVNQPVFQQPPVNQQQSFNPQQNTFAPPANTFQPPVNTPPVQQTAWNPPAQQQNQNNGQQQFQQTAGNQQSAPAQNPNVFGGNQMQGPDNGLPF